MQKLFNQARPWLIGTAILCLSFAANTAHAESIHTLLNGRELAFDVPPVIENDRTLVSMRGILEPLGATVQWDQAAQTVTANLNGKEIKVAVGVSAASVNGQMVMLDVAPRIISSRTMVPLRFFAENFGLQVSWDGSTHTITINGGSEQAVSRSGAAVSRTGALAVQTAKKLVGLPYAWGGASPDTGFDCSGFVSYVMKQAGVSLPRTSEEMFQAGIPIEKANLAAGDIVFFTTYESGPSHVGIYDGNGNFIHAENPERGVTVTPLSKDWWASRYLGARRVAR